MKTFEEIQVGDKGTVRFADYCVEVLAKIEYKGKQRLILGFMDVGGVGAYALNDFVPAPPPPQYLYCNVYPTALANWYSKPFRSAGWTTDRRLGTFRMELGKPETITFFPKGKDDNI